MKKNYKVEYYSKIAEIFIIALSVQSEQKIKGIRCIWVFIVLGIYITLVPTYNFSVKLQHVFFCPQKSA